MRSEEWAKQTKVNCKHKIKIKHRLSSPKRNVDTQRAERFCGGINYPEYL